MARGDALFLWWRDARFILGLPHLALPAGLAAFAALGGVGGAGLAPGQVARWAEILAPLLGILVMADIVARDAVVGALELASTRDGGAPALFARRFTIAAAYLALTLVLLTGTAGVGLPLATVARSALTGLVGALFFGTVAATAAHASSGAMTGASLAGALWGVATILTVLFPQSSVTSRALGPFPAMLGVAGATFGINRAAYLAAAVVLFLANRRLLRHPGRLLGRE